jgi:hypothetical protein
MPPQGFLLQQLLYYYLHIIYVFTYFLSKIVLFYKEAYITSMQWRVGSSNTQQYYNIKRERESQVSSP